MLKTNALYYGDNLQILRDYVPDESVDLIYLDPPFNSNRSYNVLFKETPGTSSQAQIEAFEDTWHWGKVAQDTFEDIALHGADNTAKLLKAMVDALGHNDVTAYLTMMAVRLVELRRVLKPTGSIYLHCDPTAGHYLKALMDSIFSPQSFVNEIAWRRYGAHNDVGQGSRHFGRVHDTLLLYSKRPERTWHQLFSPLADGYVKSTYRFVEEGTGRRFTTTPLTGPGGAAKGNPVYDWRGHTRAWRYSRDTMEKLDAEGRLYYSRTGYARQKLYLDESSGVPVQDMWADIPSLSGAHAERLGYPTQKPLALLERIINASSNPDDVVLDPFCGCGTAIHAAHKLGRRWLGIDITHLAIGLVRRRMEDAFPGLKIEVVGEPVDLSGAQELAAHDPYQFQWWALDKINAQPVGDKKKGADRGIDGIIPFMEGKADRRRVVVSVKGGGVSVKDVRELCQVCRREDEPMGVLLCLRPPTREMRQEAIAEGHYESALMGRKYPRLQILTVADILNGVGVEMPPTRAGIFAQAEREQQGEQGTLTV
jgi:DNA modification methylase